MTGLLAFGHQREYPVKNRVVLPELVTLRAKTMFATAGGLSKKLVSKQHRHRFSYTVDVMTV